MSDLAQVRARYEAADRTYEYRAEQGLDLPEIPASLADIPALLAEHELLDALAAYAKHDLDCAVTESRGRCSCGFQATYDALYARAADREASDG